MFSIRDMGLIRSNEAKHTVQLYSYSGISRFAPIVSSFWTFEVSCLVKLMENRMAGGSSN